MCWNVSPSLNIVSVGVRLMHGCFSLVHAEGHCWLALQKHTHTHTLMSASVSCTYINLYPAGDLLLQKNGNFLSYLAPLQCLKMWKITISLVTAATPGQYTVGTRTCVGPWLVACFYVQSGCYDIMQVACVTLNQRTMPAVFAALQFTECITPRRQL